MSTSASSPADNYVNMAKLARSRSRAEFLYERPMHVFVVSAFALTESGYETTGDSEQGKTVTIWPIQKTQTNAMLPNLVTVGRAASNDIQLRARSISKFHAHLQRGSDGSWQVVDSNSTFGTYVEQTRLSPGEMRPLESGNRLRMGNLNLTYYVPELLYEVLTRVSDEGGISEAQVS